MPYYIVEFHADGGQACVPGRRVFTNEDDAERFKSVMENEAGHYCRDSVHLTVSDIDPGNEGAIERICPDVRYWTSEDYSRSEYNCNLRPPKTFLRKLVERIFKP